MKRRESNQQTLKQAIERLMQAYRLSDKMLEMDVIKAWEEMMGKAIAKRTEEIFIKDKVLYLKLRSAPLREELILSKTKMIKMLNEKAGKELVKDIYFK